MHKDMKTYRQFLKEFESLGYPVQFDYDKVKTDASKFAKKGTKERDRWNTTSYITPQDLDKPISKPLSSKKEHKDYTVHHVINKDKVTRKTAAAALLHHAEHGFVGTLYGWKNKEGFVIKESHINKKHRGKGLGSALYENAVQHHEAIISDARLSKDSQKVYRHFVKKGRVSIYNPDKNMEYSPDEIKASGHKQKVKVVKGKMRSKHIGPFNLSHSDEFALKIHKQKLK